MGTIQRKSARAVARAKGTSSIEGEWYEATYFVEPDPEGTWTVLIEVVRHLNDRHTPAKWWTQKLPYVAYSLQRVDEDNIAKPYVVATTRQSWFQELGQKGWLLQLRGKDGKTLFNL